MVRVHISSSLIFTTLALGAGCIADADPVEVASQPAGAAGGDDCPVSECGSNGAVLNDFFYELDERGIANDQGMQLMGISIGGVGYGVDVVGTEIRAVKEGLTTLGGDEVEDGVIEVRDKDNETWTIRIAAVHRTALYPDDGTLIYAYNFQVTAPGADHERNLCNKAEALSGDRRETLGLNKFTAVVSDGDRYREATLEILPPGRATFSIGCASTLISKLVLTHHADVTSTTTYSTTLAQRQALLNALTANMCGNGVSFTINGRAVSWTNRTFLPNIYDVTELDLDGRYDEHGATCIGKPRLTGTTSQDAIDTWGPDVGAEITNIIRATCERVGHPLPRCLDVEDLDPLQTWGHPIAISGVF